MLVALSQPLLGWTLAGRGPAARPQREHVCMCAAAPAAAVTFNDLVSEAQRLTDEQCAKTLLEACCEATLCTRPAAMDDAGAGFASHVSYVPDEDGSPLFPLFDTATAANLQAAPQATFLAHAPAGAVQAGSATLLGAVEPYDSAELTDFQLSQLSERTGHTVEELAARPWHKLVPTHVHFFDAIRASENWVSLNEFKTASANPLAACAAQLLRKLNSENSHELARFAATYGGWPADDPMRCELVGVDQVPARSPARTPAPIRVFARPPARPPATLPLTPPRPRYAVRRGPAGGARRVGGALGGARRLQGAAADGGGGGLDVHEALPGDLGAPERGLEPQRRSAVAMRCKKRVKNRASRPNR